ncbi:MAG: bifunctional diaminohydroxyphosphoribosylaminopyrimidine deaminase/5-amino-6-(5-phosphoribosylamino)uracil reductase RibD [Niabella sp.]
MNKGYYERYMQRCFQLAQLGAGNVAPNPMVGAILVYNDQIIGEGYHQKYGAPHAEVHCINDALRNHADKIPAATLYVSLEPCAHYGKTPPCADLIISHKIPKVVIGCRDSFEQVDGRGIAKLEAAGVSVEVGILEQEAVSLNKAFFTFHRYKRPYVILKWAQTADGYIASATDQRLYISNDYTNRLVHRWRSETAAIMIGANTAIKDDPLLDNRNWFGPPPGKIVFDPNLKVSAQLRLFNISDVVVVLNTVKDAVAKNIIYLKIDPKNMIGDALRQLFSLNIQSIFVEGGQKLLQLFIDSGLWDETRIITHNQLYTGHGLAAPRLQDASLLSRTNLLTDEVRYFKNTNHQFLYAAIGLL